MKFLVSLMISLISVHAFADWTIESKKYFTQKTSIVKDSSEFLEYYLDEIEALGNKQLVLSQLLTLNSETAFIYQFVDEKNKVSLDCMSSENLTDCLYGSYEKYLFVVVDAKGELVSIGNSFMLPRNAVRFGESIVEQEAFFFQGENAGTAIIENW